MAQKQEALPGIPQPKPRKVIEEIEDLCLDIDKDSGKRTAISDKIAEKNEARQQLLLKHKLETYTYERADGVLMDVYIESAVKKRKSKLNPKKPKKGADE